MTKFMKSIWYILVTYGIIKMNVKEIERECRNNEKDTR